MVKKHKKILIPSNFPPKITFTIALSLPSAFYLYHELAIFTQNLTKVGMQLSLEDNQNIQAQYEKLLNSIQSLLQPGDKERIDKALEIAKQAIGLSRSRSGRPAIFRTLDIANIVVHEIGMGRVSLISTLLYDVSCSKHIPLDTLEADFGKLVRDILEGLVRATDLYVKSTTIETENFRKLLLTFAQDIRVIFIMIADRLQTMRYLNYFSTEEQIKIAQETSFLYAPLAHRLGLYRIKSELEDLALKYSNRDTYKEIAQKLNETKLSRESYITEFINPIKEKLTEAGFKNFEVKGRTKTIHSILNKINKQHVAFEHIYDLFAIRIILDSEPHLEKADCWRVYSLVTDKYAPNPKRLRDWLSIPKSNGYESLHTTVMGPKGKYVEVQIRTKRMDEIAEKGFAAHWRYKGIKQEKGLDDWLTNIREIIENPDKNAADVISDFKLGLYEKEVFAFTPKGDLRKLPKGATILDFAFDIHTAVGSKCVGAIINGKNYSIRHQISNGDQIHILTTNNQEPKEDWLKIVTTSRAKTKIRQALKEVIAKDANLGKEMLIRRFKNWKITQDDATLQKLIKQKKFNTTTDFYYALHKGKVDIYQVRDFYLAQEKKEQEPTPDKPEDKTAENFTVAHDDVGEDILTIDQNLKGIDFSLAKCCNPIYGDEIFGFVGSQGGIKIHRTNCPNSTQMVNRFGYRIVKAQWSGKAGSQYETVIRVTGHDDIGIISNISQLITNDLKVKMRSLNIDSKDGYFYGNITLFINDLGNLNKVIKKIKAIKGVLDVQRIDGK